MKMKLAVKSGDDSSSEGYSSESSNDFKPLKIGVKKRNNFGLGDSKEQSFEPSFKEDKLESSSHQEQNRKIKSEFKELNSAKKPIKTKSELISNQKMLLEKMLAKKPQNVDPDSDSSSGYSSGPEDNHKILFVEGDPNFILDQIALQNGKKKLSKEEAKAQNRKLLEKMKSNFQNVGDDSDSDSSSGYSSTSNSKKIVDHFGYLEDQIQVVQPQIRDRDSLSNGSTSQVQGNFEFEFDHPSSNEA